MNKFCIHLKNSKKILKNIKFDNQRYFNMKMMFNSLDRPFELLNLRYGVKHGRFCDSQSTIAPLFLSLSLSLSLYIYSKSSVLLNSQRSSVSLTQKVYQIISKFWFIMLIKFFIWKFMEYKNLRCYEFSNSSFSFFVNNV
jgi:hypothetical protein